jgi:hypothetical protein
VDSIPAAFAITKNEFLIYTSNIFAVMGLRAMFFLLAGIIDKFYLLQKGLSIILLFIGAKMLLETINQRYGLAIQPAEKRSKTDYIDLLNGDFLTGRIKIIHGSELERELEGLQWDLSNDAKIILARTNRLREDPSCPNHLCDALLYIWRFTYHFYAQPHVSGPPIGSPEWQQLKEDAEIERYIARRKAGAGLDPLTLALKRMAQERPLTSENHTWKLTIPSR